MGRLNNKKNGATKAPPENFKTELSQLFTPWYAAQAMCQYAKRTGLLEDGCDVLEPSCGRGVLIDAALTNADCRVHAYELDPYWYRIAKNAFREEIEEDRVGIQCGNFLSFAADGRVPFCDVAIINPPYENNLDSRFVEACLSVTGDVLAILNLSFVGGADRYKWLWSKYYLLKMIVFPSRLPFEGSAHGTGMDYSCMFHVSRYNRVMPSERMVEFYNRDNYEEK